MATPNPDIARAVKRITEHAAKIKKYRAYYDGDHPLNFATAKFDNAFGELFQEFAYNLCPGVVDAVADRLRITGFGTTPAAQDLWEIWDANLMPLRSGETHQEALTVGDAYLIVWPGPDGAPVISVNQAEQCAVWYDPEVPGRVVWGAKLWTQDDKRLRLTLYYANRIEKYVTAPRAGSQTPPTSRAFAPYQVPGEAWPLPNPYERPPIFHFANNARIGKLGRSELHDVLPLQDALNKSVCDMLVNMEFAAFKQRWATGVEIVYDPKTGKPINRFEPGPGSIWAVDDPDGRFGQFDATDLNQFLAVTSAFEQRMARVSRTSVHFLMLYSGNWPSGESLKTAESPFLAKVGDRQDALGPVWAEVGIFALRIAGVRATRKDIAPDWQDAAPKSAKESAETAQIKKGIGVPLRVLLKELDYTDTEIEKMLAADQADQQSATDLVLARVRAEQLAAQTAAARANGSGPAFGDTGPVERL